MERCQHLRIRPDKDGKVRARADYAYVCAVELPDVVLPISITSSHNWQWPPHRAPVSLVQCARCPLHSPLVKTRVKEEA